jgi:putative nucleotidyltransferase with HDIG domain
MKKILVVEDNEQLCDFIINLIQNSFDCDIFKALNGERALEILNEEEIDVIVSDYMMPKMTGGGLYLQVKENYSDIPFILLATNKITSLPEFSSFHEDNKLNYYLQKPKEISKLTDVLTDIVQGLGDDLTSCEHDYRALSISYLFRLTHTPVEVFIQLSKEKHLKILNKDADFDHDFLRKYKKKGVEEVFIKKEDYADFTADIMTILTQSIDSKDRSERGKMVDKEMAMKLIYSDMAQLRLDEFSLDSAKSTIEGTVKMMESRKDTLTCLNNMLQQENYLYEHSLSTSFICTAICQASSNWNDAKNTEQLTIAALFHDISLAGENAQKYDTQAFDDINELKEKAQQVEFFGHPKASVEMFMKSECTKQDVPNIILQHHEKPDGSGFPRKLTAKSIIPLACVFIVAEDFVTNVYNKEITPHLAQDVLEKMMPKYTEGNFLKAFEGLQKALDN